MSYKDIAEKKNYSLLYFMHYVNQDEIHSNKRINSICTLIQLFKKIIK